MLRLSNFLALLFSTLVEFSVSKCSVIVKTLSDISNNIPDLEFLTDLE